ncbi:hypothetical protein Nepgr_000417 [Nepenthes gracilis]|uniref:RNA polymerase II subunit 5-mediating protein homolog n=1 Tax=Nepenthes gracilis TaxID=150966 RepID=A0AAD3RWT7_NEPGR|nr:hypothetical protein Nepgr_000417 [Nepenthes gracilis]
MADRAKGTVTSLSSIFPAEEALKASKRVQDTIAEKQRELDSILHFVADNANLINLVQRLPDELHHDIMVPFGKAAFFPGRLIHTNEFLVLLGEGYYAERTSKQTVEIFKRREKVLESQVDSLKAMMEDLKAEASFFNATAAEASEGLLEIREEYIDEDFRNKVSNAGNQNRDTPSSSGEFTMTGPVDDEEYARMMSRFDELEKEELVAEITEELDEDEQSKAGLDYLYVGHLEDEYNEAEEDFDDQLNLESSNFQAVQKGESVRGKALGDSAKVKLAEDSLISERKMNHQSAPSPKDEVSVSISEPPVATRMFEPATDSLKAFTGCIIERTDNLPMNPKEPASSKSSGSQPSKPVSRFKMQRR